jgi:uncharacterized phage-like protein YoqJ
MTITFVGHSLIVSMERVKEMVKKQIRKNILASETLTCYLGGYGDFDELCAGACRELKREYGGIEIVYVTPYINLQEQKKMKEMIRYGLYDSSIYPSIENVPLRFAISKRNEWMITNADLIIAYVNHSYGGAYKTIQIAKRKKKKIINIYDLI